MKNRIRKNSFWTETQIEAIEQIAVSRFGSKARWSATLSFLMDMALPTALEQLNAMEDERLETTRMALDIQRKRIAAAELGEEYTTTLDSLTA